MAAIIQKKPEGIIESPSSKNITRAQKLLSYSVKEFEDDFKRGYMDAGQYHDLLRERAHAVLDQAIADKGFPKVLLEETVKNMQKGWDDIVNAAKETQGAENIIDRIKPASMTLWGTIQMLTGALSAAGKVSGHQAERWALSAGASPGMARLINISVDVGSGFVPMGQATKLGVKATQGVMKIGAAAKSGEAVVAKAASEIASDAIKQSLAVEGVGEAVAKEAVTVPLTAKEKFLQDFATFKRTMASVTDTQTHEQTAKLAKELNIGLDELRTVVPGQALNEREMYAYLKALEPQVEETIRLAKVAKVSGDEADLNAFAAHMSDFLSVAPIFRGAEVTAGRSVEILKDTPPMKRITDMLVGWDAEAMAAGDFSAAIRTMADEIAVASPQQLTQMGVQSRTLWTQFKEGAWPKMREAYYNLLLPMAIIPNTLGGAVALATTTAERFTGALFSADKATGLVGKEGWFLVKGYTAAFGDGLSEFGRAFKGVAPNELSKLDYIPHQIPGIVGQAVNLPSDTLRGTDNFFRTLLRRGSYNADAIREGVHKGMSDVPSVISTAEYRAQFGTESLTEFVTRRVQNPTAEMVTAGDAFATHHTYQDAMGALAEKLRGLQTGPGVLYFPFMKSPINLTKYAWDRTPGLQLISRQLYRDIAEGGVKADEAIARITLANMQGMFIYQMAQEGYLTGSGPVDPALRSAWLATHQPYSIKTKDGWMLYTNYEPANTPVGLIADFAQIHNQLDNPSAEQAAMAATFSLLRGMVDKTWWRTLGSMVDMAGSIREGVSPSTQLLDVLWSPITTVASGGPLGGAIKRAIDPIQRESRTWIDLFTSRIPGYSESVPALRDVYGDPVLPPQHVAGPLVPVKTRTIEPDRVAEEGDRLKISVPQFPWIIGGSTRDDFNIRAPLPTDTLGVEMTPKQRERAQILYRERLRHPVDGIEQDLLADPDYATEPFASQREMFMDQLAVYRKQAIEALVAEDPTLGAKVLESQAAKILPKLQRNEQDQLRRETDVEVRDLFSTMPPEQQENLLKYGQPPGED